ncbi:MAG TPA: hypothetical protein VGE94_05590, partial [Chloroflexota bacterium]
GWSVAKITDRGLDGMAPSMSSRHRTGLRNQIGPDRLGPLWSADNFDDTRMKFGWLVAKQDAAAAD